MQSKSDFLLPTPFGNKIFVPLIFIIVLGDKNTEIKTLEKV